MVVKNGVAQGSLEIGMLQLRKRRKKLGPVRNSLLACGILCSEAENKTLLGGLYINLNRLPSRQSRKCEVLVCR